MELIASLLFCILYFFISLVSLLVLFFLTPKKIHKIYRRLDLKEEGKRVESIRPFVQPGDSILDVGAGSGRFGRVVQEKLGVKVTGVDVCDYSDHSIPFFVYNGKELPFPDKSFDVIFFAFVLHHIERDGQEKILHEACRVARKKIVIFEDSYDYFFERLFTGWNDYHTNIFQGWIKSYKGYLKGNPAEMPMPLTFRSPEGWNNFFHSYPVKIISQEVRKMGYKPLKKITFCLEVIP